MGVELKGALDRHDRGESIVIPVILRDCDWKTQRFAALQALPAGGKPVTRFRPRDAGWTDVVLGIRRVASNSTSLRSREEWGGDLTAAPVINRPPAFDTSLMIVAPDGPTIAQQQRQPSRSETASRPKESRTTNDPALMREGPLVKPDRILAAIVGTKPMLRAQLTKLVWDYVKTNGLQDRSNKRMINADDKLQLLFGGKRQVSMFEMTALVNKHVIVMTSF